MSELTTTALFVSRVGTGWTINVTLLNLSDILPLKDFQVVDVAAQVFLNVANFTKTSSTVLTYTGPALVGLTALEVRRDTPIADRYYEIPHGSYLNSQALNEELDRILRKLNEIKDFPGSVLGAFILDQVYGAAWATDNITSRTAKNVYDEMETRAKKIGATLTNAVLNDAVVLDPLLLSDESQAVAYTAWVKGQGYGSAAAIAALNAKPEYKRIGRFTGANASVGTLNLTAVPGTIEGNRLYYEFKGIFSSDISIFVRPNELENSTVNPNVQSNFVAGAPTYNLPNFGSYLNSFWIGYCQNATDSKMWGSGEFQWLSGAGTKEIHSMSHCMFHSPSLNYGVIDIRSLGANSAYTTPKTIYTIFGVDVNTGAVARALPTSFTFDVFAYVTP